MIQLIQRATIYVDDDGEQSSANYLWVMAWLERWQGQVAVADYSSGGWEHLWNVSGPPSAIKEVPTAFLCDSAWVQSPQK